PPAPVAVDKPDRPGNGRAQRGLRLLVRHPADRYARDLHARLYEHRRSRIPSQRGSERRNDEHGQGQTAKHAVTKSYLRSERSPRSPGRASVKRERRDEPPQRRPSNSESLGDTSCKSRTREESTWLSKSFSRPPRPSSPTARASSPRTRARARSRSGSTRSASSRRRRRAALIASCSSPPRASRSSSAA